MISKKKQTWLLGVANDKTKSISRQELHKDRTYN